MQPPKRITLDAYRFGILTTMFLEEPYRRLSAVYDKQGDQEQAQFFSYLADATKQAHNDELAAMKRSFTGSPADR